jgi:hypothetical protein
MRSAKLIAMGAHNIGDFECRTHQGALTLRVRSGIGQQIQWAGRGTDRMRGQAQVTGGGGQTAVTEKKLNPAQIGACLQQVYGIGVPEGLLVLLIVCNQQGSAIAFILSMTSKLR